MEGRGSLRVDEACPRGGGGVAGGLEQGGGAGRVRCPERKKKKEKERALEIKREGERGRFKWISCNV